MYRKNLVFIAACLGMLLFGVVFLSLGTFSVFIQETLHVDASRVASLASLLPFGMLTGSLLFGPVVDRYGYKMLLIICTLLIALSLELVANAKSMSLMQLSFFLIGFGGGVINGGTNALVADIATGGKGARLSMLGVFYGVGALGMPLLIGHLSRNFNSGAVISIIGFTVLLPMIFFMVIKFPAPKQKQGFPIKEALSLIKEPLLLLLGFILFLESAMEGIIGNWSTTFLKSVNLPVEYALYALSCEVAAIALIRLLLSRLLLKIPTLLIMYSSFALIFTGAVLLIAVSSFPLAILSMLCLGAGFAACFPVILGYVGELYAKMTGTAFSIVIVMALTGNTLLNFMVGIVTRLWGIAYLPVIIMICALCITLVYSIAEKRIPKKTKI